MQLAYKKLDRILTFSVLSADLYAAFSILLPNMVAPQVAIGIWTVGIIEISRKKEA